MNKKNKNQKNILDFVPKTNSKIKWRINEKNLVTIIVTRSSFTDLLSQKLFGAPKQTEIDLDEYGSRVWLSIDGEATLMEISDIMSRTYGKSAEPVYERLIQFFLILQKNKLVQLKEAPP